MATSLGETTEDVLNQLDALAPKARGKLTAKVPHQNDTLGQGWMPPPPKHEVRALVSSDCTRIFKRFTKKNGSSFSEPGNLKPNYLNLWVSDRVTQPERNYKYPKDFQPYRTHHQSCPLPETTDDLLHPMHRTWLDGHFNQRERHVYPIYHAKKDVEKAREALNKKAEMLALTREIVSTPQLQQPNISAESKGKLSRAMTKMRTGRALAQAGGGTGMTREEELQQKKMQKRLETALSAPALRVIEPTPEYRAKHIRTWNGPEKPLRYLRSSTPWQHQDELMEMKHQRGQTLLSASK
jgi:hypothetical protein